MPYIVKLIVPGKQVRTWEHATSEAASSQARALSDLFAIAYTRNGDDTQFTIDATSTFQPQRLD